MKSGVWKYLIKIGSKTSFKNKHLLKIFFNVKNIKKEGIINDNR